MNEESMDMGEAANSSRNKRAHSASSSVGAEEGAPRSSTRPETKKRQIILNEHQQPAGGGVNRWADTGDAVDYGENKGNEVANDVSLADNNAAKEGDNKVVPDDKEKGAEANGMDENSEV
jgi:hypothetical protein